MIATLETLENRIVSLEKTVNGITTTLNRISNELEFKVNNTDLSRTDSLLRELITDISTDVQKMEARLAKVILPEETQYYLDGADVETFQSNFNKLKGMMIQFDKLYKNLVAYEANRTS